MKQPDSINRLLDTTSIEAELERRRAPFRALFPDVGALRRELYPKHLEFFAQGARFKERLFMAGNRLGKTVAGAFETTCHLTGLYPAWWDGFRFSAAVDGWACGTNSQTTRDVVQGVLLGRPDRGLIPPELIVHKTAGRGLADSVETVSVRHVSGGDSRLTFKTYEQGRRSFEGAAKLNVPANFVLAVAAAESTYGTSNFATSYNNYFGLHWGSLPAKYGATQSTSNPIAAQWDPNADGFLGSGNVFVALALGDGAKGVTNASDFFKKVNKQFGVGNASYASQMVKVLSSVTAFLNCP